jgi:hypothetical protein
MPVAGEITVLLRDWSAGNPAATVPEFLELGVKMLPQYIKDRSDLRQAQMGLAESMYENGDLDSAQRVLTQTTASAKAAKDIPAEAESEAFSGNIAYLQGQMDVGEALTAHALELSRKPGVSPAARAWSAIFYAWNRDNNGYRSDENVRLLQFAVKECRDNNLTPRATWIDSTGKSYFQARDAGANPNGVLEGTWTQRQAAHGDGSQ